MSFDQAVKLAIRFDLLILRTIDHCLWKVDLSSLEAGIVLDSAYLVADVLVPAVK